MGSEKFGQKLYDKIQDTIIPEWTKAFEEINLDDCIEYIYDVTLERSYDGYHREEAVYRELGVAFDDIIVFEKTDSVTDSAWSIDYIGHIKKIKIGIQVKPPSAKSNSSGYSIANRNIALYNKFKKKFGGEVFEVYSKKDGRKNLIVNKEVIEEVSNYLKKI